MYCDNFFTIARVHLYIQISAGPKIAFILCVCSSANITCAKLRHSVTMPTSAGLRQARLVLCCLYGERVVGNDDSSVLSWRVLIANWIANCCVSTFYRYIKLRLICC